MERNTELRLMAFGRERLLIELEQIVDGKVLFKHDGHSVTDPWTDVTGRDTVDPIEYYGVEKLVDAIELQEPAKVVSLEPILIERFKPEREWLTVTYVDSDLSMDEKVEYVNSKIEKLWNTYYRVEYPETTEIRWNFEYSEQGHYINV